MDILKGLLLVMLIILFNFLKNKKVKKRNEINKQPVSYKKDSYSNKINRDLGQYQLNQSTKSNKKRKQTKILKDRENEILGENFLTEEKLLQGIIFSEILCKPKSSRK